MLKPELKKLSKFNKLLAMTFLLGSLSVNAEAAEMQATVNVRAKNGQLKPEVRTLKDLYSTDRFEGAYFKIVEDESNEAISTSAPEELRFKAATAYYHYTVARDYALTLEHFQAPAINEQTTIRIEMSSEYSRSIHFDPSKEIYNNTRTIGPSDDFIAEGILPWKAETFYRKPKLLPRPATAAYVGHQLSSPQFSAVVLDQLLAQDLQTMSVAAANHRFVPQQHLVSLLLSVGLAELLPRVLGLGLKQIKSKEMIDTVMIPEIIYHEYAHLLFGHRLGFQISTQILEGYPNYFAAKVSGLKTLAGKDGKYGRGFVGKKSSSKALYNFDEETYSMAIYGSFTFSVLVQLEKALGDEGEMIIFKALNYLSGDSRLNMEFPRAIATAIDEVSAYPQSQKLAAQALFDSRGF